MVYLRKIPNVLDRKIIISDKILLVLSALFGLAGGIAGLAFAAIPAEYQAVIDLETYKLYTLEEQTLNEIISSSPETKRIFDSTPTRYEDPMKRVWIKELNRHF